MNATIPESSGERSRLPVSGFRRKPFSGTTPHSSRAPKTVIAAAANRRPRRSDASSRFSSGRPPSPAYGPRRGTTIRSVTQAPAAAMKKVEAAMKK